MAFMAVSTIARVHVPGGDQDEDVQKAMRAIALALDGVDVLEALMQEWERTERREPERKGAEVVPIEEVRRRAVVG